MDRYTDIRDDLDNTFEQMDMKSATIHSNEYGKTYTFRFKYGHPNKGSNERSNKNDHRTFVMRERSQYQMKKNRIRANLFKFSHPGRNYYDKTEHPRNCENSAVSETNLDISPVSTHDPLLSTSQLTDDCFAQSSSGYLDEFSPSHTEYRTALASIQYAETTHLTPEEFVDESSQLIELPSVEEFVCHETLENDSDLNQASSAQISSISPVIYPLINLNTGMEIVENPNPKSTELLYTPEEIELDYNLPRDQCSNVSDNDLLCGVCNALPPAGSKLHICMNCSEVLCGYCETLPSSCQHAMAGRKKHKPHVVSKKSKPVPVELSSPKRLKVKNSALPRLHPIDDSKVILNLKPTSYDRVERKPPDQKTLDILSEIYHNSRAIRSQLEHYTLQKN